MSYLRQYFYVIDSDIPMNNKILIYSKEWINSDAHFFFEDQMGVNAVLDILGTKVSRNAHVTIF